MRHAQSVARNAPVRHSPVRRTAAGMRPAYARRLGAEPHRPASQDRHRAATEAMTDAIPDA
jgi:hypothetical protein